METIGYRMEKIMLRTFHSEHDSGQLTVYQIRIKDHPCHKGEKTMKTKEKINTYRTTATVVGIIYLAGFVVGLTGAGFIQSILGAPHRLTAVSANSILLTIGALLWVMAVV